MGDRGTLRFEDGAGNVSANFYIHWEGSRLDEVWAEFVQWESDLITTGQHDNRWSDPSYLAARFAGWYYQRNDRGMGIGIIPGTERMGYADWFARCDHGMPNRLTRTS